MQPQSKRRLDRGVSVRYPRSMGVKDGQSGKDEKAERLAQALRENLKRRKGQARARRAAAQDENAAQPAPGADSAKPDTE